MAKVGIQLKDGTDIEKVLEQLKSLSNVICAFRKYDKPPHHIVSSINYEFYHDWRAVAGIVEENLNGIERIEPIGRFRY